jgi:hypothetical protein
MKRFILNVSQQRVQVQVVPDEALIHCNQFQSPKNERLIHYIEQAGYDSICLDQTLDIFNKKRISHYKTFRTDGSWIWSSDLNYYTIHHGFLWPAQFMQHLGSQKEPLSSEELLASILSEYRATLRFILFGVVPVHEKLLEYQFVPLGYCQLK